jgi:WD40 repeat protein
MFLWPACMQHAAFSPDGKRVVVGEWGNVARVWDVARREVVLTLKGHESWVIGAAYSPDGKRIVTASGDATARVWDAVTGELQLVFRGHRGTVSRAVFSPDGKSVLTSSVWDNTARLWPLDPLVLARQRVPRELTAAERERFHVPSTNE